MATVFELKNNHYQRDTDFLGCNAVFPTFRRNILPFYFRAKGFKRSDCFFDPKKQNSLTLQIKALRSFKMLKVTNPLTQRRIPEHINTAVTHSNFLRTF